MCGAFVAMGSTDVVAAESDACFEDGAGDWFGALVWRHNRDGREILTKARKGKIRGHCIKHPPRAANHYKRWEQVPRGLRYFSFELHALGWTLFMLLALFHDGATQA